MKTLRSINKYVQLPGSPHQLLPLVSILPERAGKNNNFMLIFMMIHILDGRYRDVLVTL